MTPSKDIAALLDIMAALRTHGSGCPWDLVQTFETIVPYTIEEAYEVADAVERGDYDDLREELGDLLLQVVFHARMAEEAGCFAFGDVVEAISRKLIRRHPHVFGSARDLAPSEVKVVWEEIKAAEKAERRGARQMRQAGLLDDIPANLPALTRAAKLQAKAASVGFDWDDANLVLAKVREEVAEVAEASAGADEGAVREEIGDLLFAVVNLARHHGVDPEAALRGGNIKFERRFSHIEASLARRGRTPKQSDLAEMEALWVEAKGLEKAASAGPHPASKTTGSADGKR